MTHLADRKSRQFIRRVKRKTPEAFLVVTGCYAQTAAAEIGELAGVDMILGNSEKEQVVELVEESLERGDVVTRVSDIMSERNYRETPIWDFMDRTRATVKIQEGCNEYCSYCIIPFARGRQRSRQPADVVSELKRLAARGFREVVLTGINLSSYGSELAENVDLLSVLERIHEIDGLRRIRLSSLEPMGMSERMLAGLASLPRICPHLHIPLQAGTDRVLARMRRNYTTEQFSKLVERARELIPSVNITTDIMVGFPGETEEDFAQGVEFVRSIGFGRLHVFPYSPRQGTRAYYLDGHVSSEELNSRRETMLALAEKSGAEFETRFLGQIMEVLVEGPAGKESADGGLFQGLTANYIRVVFPAPEELAGRFVRVKLVERTEGLVCGTLVAEKHT